MSARSRNRKEMYSICGGVCQDMNLIGSEGTVASFHPVQAFSPTSKKRSFEQHTIQSISIYVHAFHSFICQCNAMRPTAALLSRSVWKGK